MSTTMSEASASKRPLPPGWEKVEHRQGAIGGENGASAGSVQHSCWVHAPTRVVSWTEPYTLRDFDTIEMVEAPAVRRLLIDLATKQAEEYDERRAASGREPPPAPLETLTAEEQLARDLHRQPRLSCAEFLARGGAFNGKGFVKTANIPLFFLENYCNLVLGARVVYSQDMASDGPWAQPPHRCRVVVLGIAVAEALYSASEEACKSLAAENACLKLCPTIYWEALRSLSFRLGRVLKPTITDLDKAASLRVDDDRVLEIDSCVCKTPPMMVQEYIVRQYGQTFINVQGNEAHGELYPGGRPQPGYEMRITLGGKVYSGFDKTSKRAKQRAAVQLLRHTHPEVATWGGMMELYPLRVDGDGKDLPTLASRSQVAEDLLRSDKFSPYTPMQRLQDKKLAERAAPESSRSGGTMAAALPPGIQGEPALLLQQTGGALPGGASADGGGGGGEIAAAGGGLVDGGGLDQIEGALARGGLRAIPGQGQDFAYAWQRQFDLENARRAALSEGAKIENDTLFAFRFDHAREVLDGAKLDVLRSVVADLEATEHTEQLRANEPATLGQSQRSQGLDQRQEWAKAAPRSEAKAAEGLASQNDFQWAPWRHGTRTHEALKELSWRSRAAEEQAAAEALRSGELAKTAPAAGVADAAKVLELTAAAPAAGLASVRSR